MDLRPREGDGMVEDVAVALGGGAGIDAADGL